jgi:glycosyltransferase involved in cell wall biosynthesis
MSLNRVSVIIPAYNSGEYLAETLSSILEQTHKPFEIIVINDGSTDATDSIIDLFSRINPAIKSISQGNKGLSAARNVGKSSAIGDFIAFCDADDVWLPQKLENQVRLLNLNVEYLAVASNYSTFRGRTDISKDGKLPSFQISPTNLLSGLAWIPGSASSILIRNTHEISMMYFDENLSFAEDLDMWVGISKVGKIAIIDSNDVLIRLHEKSMQSSFQTNPNPYLDSMFQIVNKVFIAPQNYFRRWVVERLVVWLVVKSILKGNLDTYNQVDWNHSFRNATTLKVGKKQLFYSILPSLLLGTLRAFLIKVSSFLK